MESREWTEWELKQYRMYRKGHIEHNNECRMCRSPSIQSNLYEGYRECIACKNDKGEGYPFQPSPPKGIEQYFNIKQLNDKLNKKVRHTSN